MLNAPLRNLPSFRPTSPAPLPKGDKLGIDKDPLQRLENKRLAREKQNPYKKFFGGVETGILYDDKVRYTGMGKRFSKFRKFAKGRVSSNISMKDAVKMGGILKKHLSAYKTGVQIGRKEARQMKREIWNQRRAKVGSEGFTKADIIDFKKIVDVIVEDNKQTRQQIKKNLRQPQVLSGETSITAKGNDSNILKFPKLQQNSEVTAVRLPQTNVRPDNIIEFPKKPQSDKQPKRSKPAKKSSATQVNESSPLQATAESLPDDLEDDLEDIDDKEKKSIAEAIDIDIG